jgi:hypothetical protein
MTSELITQGVWRRLTAAARKTHRPSLVSVAYFGKDAASLLPLRKGSRLVVDASEAAVSSGQTCPADLSKLNGKGVRIYSVANLHAKLFVLGSRVYIGSANASHHSAGTMLEAVLETTDRDTLRAARDYVRSLCLHELGPEELARLAKLYKPPRMKGRRKKQCKKNIRKIRPDIPMLRIDQLVSVEDYPSGSEATKEKADKKAKEKRQHRKSHELDVFHIHGNSPHRVGETVMQVVDEGGGRKYVVPPGNVIYKKKWRNGAKHGTFVYVEIPRRRRKRLAVLVKQVGYGAKKRLSRNGKVANRALVERILAAWKQ